MHTSRPHMTLRLNKPLGWPLEEEEEEEDASPAELLLSSLDLSLSWMVSCGAPDTCRCEEPE